MLFIKNAKYLKDYLISIEFSSGEKGMILPSMILPILLDRPGAEIDKRSLPAG